MLYSRNFVRRIALKKTRLAGLQRGEQEIQLSPINLARHLSDMQCHGWRTNTRPLLIETMSTKSKPKVFFLILKVENKFPSNLANSFSDNCFNAWHTIIIHFILRMYADYILKLSESELWQRYCYYYYCCFCQKNSTFKTKTIFCSYH